MASGDVAVRPDSSMLKIRAPVNFDLSMTSSSRSKKSLTAFLLKPQARAIDVASGWRNDNSGWRFRKV